MSWKLSRAAYYQSQKGGRINPQTSKWLNLFFLISFIFSIIFVNQALGDPDNEIEFFAIFGGFSLVTTPILFEFF